MYYLQIYVYVFHVEKYMDFPGGSVVIICLPMQETQVRCMIQEDPTSCRATKSMCHTIEPMLLSLEATTTEAHVP